MSAIRRSQFNKPTDYLYPGTDVLRNTLKLFDAEALDRAEQALTFGRLRELHERPIKGKFDLPHLQAIHRHIFQDLYAWAGQLRTVNLSKGTTVFCNVIHLRSQTLEVFEGLARVGSLKGSDPATFARQAGSFLADLTPWATDPVWSKLAPTVRAALLDADRSFLLEQLSQHAFELVVINGAQALAVFEREITELSLAHEIPRGAGGRHTVKTGKWSNTTVIGWTLNVPHHGTSAASRTALTAFLQNWHPDAG